MLEKFFKPKTVAVIGASGDKNKVGYSLLSNLIESGCEVYPVTLGAKEILGKKTFSSVSEISERVDLAIIAVKAEIVPRILQECGEKNISSAIIISSGFKEAGLSGAELEDEIKKIAAEKNIKVLGPNCLGLINTANGLNASFAGKKPIRGKIALLSQSGALGTAMIDWALGEEIGFSKFVSLGNEVVLSEIDFLKYLENDPETSAILMYLENISNGSEFLKTVKNITPKKPVIIIKAGMGSHGSLAVMSHTGALAPQPAVFISACKQAGAVTTSSLRGFFNTVKLLSQISKINPPVQRLIILTNGGGPSVVTADLIDRSKSLSLLALKEETKESLRRVLPGAAAIGNPVDILGDALAERYDKSLEILCREDADGIIVILTPQMMTEPEKTAKVLAKYKKIKNIFPVFIGGSDVSAGKKELVKNGLVGFDFPRDVVDGLDYLARGAAKIKAQGHDSSCLSNQSSLTQMPFKEMVKIFSDYGLQIEGEFVDKKENLAEEVTSLGEGPFVMKAISPAVVHKTDAGLVRLGVPNLDKAARVWTEFATNPKIENKMEGVLVQKMNKGREIIIGMKRDNTFGPTILFGLGGILAEALKDTSLRIAPVDKKEALQMMREIKGIKILEGLRGEPPVDFDKLAEIIASLSKLTLDHPEIKEIDLNPVMATENDALIVDARVMV